MKGAGIGKMERNQEIDALRGSAMCLVIYGHALQMFFFGGQYPRFNLTAFFVWKCIYAFHMPAFYFVSGLIARNARCGFRSNELVRPLALIFFASATQILVALPLMVYQHHTGRPLNYTGLFIRPILLGIDYTLVVTCFLFSLAAVEILALCFFNCRIPGRIVVCLISIGGLFLHRELGIDWFECQSLGAGLLFYLVGSYAIKYQCAAERLKIWKIAVLSLISLAALCLLAPLNHGTAQEVAKLKISTIKQYDFGVILALGDYGNLYLFAVTAMFGIAFLSFFCLTIRKTRLFVFAIWIGRNSLFLFIVNGIALRFVQPYLEKAIQVSNYRGTSLILAAAFTSVQIVIFPLARPFITNLYDLCRRTAQKAICISTVKLKPLLYHSADQEIT
jgi:fucose 4-O-acetylase-like acetyltransferase